ncbi:MAG: hypothetical protein IPJ98_28330 [Bryobacterales bacterium]|nr:hypothetical protein [Bryobacterales bacterium]
MAIKYANLPGLAGGAAVAGALSPVPWKPLDDPAIWTQNWSWTPTRRARPGDGECSLGCARCARRVVV